MKTERENLKCPECGAAICFTDARCMFCGVALDEGRTAAAKSAVRSGADQGPQLVEPLRRSTILLCRLWLVLAAVGVIVALLGLLMIFTGGSQLDAGMPLVLIAFAVAVWGGWVIPLGWGAIYLMRRRPWAWWVLLFQSGIVTVFCLVFHVYLWREAFRAFHDGRGRVPIWELEIIRWALVPLLMAAIFAAAVVILLRDHPSRWRDRE